MRDRTQVPVLGLCVLVATAAYLMVFTLLGQIGATLGASRTALDWITIATVIVGTVSSALMSALGAVLGERRLMVISMGCLATGSLVSALAPDVAVLLIGRVVAANGLPAAALGIAIVRERRSGPGLARALGVIAAFGGGRGGHRIRARRGRRGGRPGRLARGLPRHGRPRRGRRRGGGRDRSRRTGRGRRGRAR
jgi:predicted MFS family arabinose efflux permease